MPLPYLHPPTSSAWGEHHRRVALCRGGACFTALAQFYGTDAPNQIEKLIDERGPYPVGDGERSWSGKYRRWLRDGKAPKDDTIELVWRKTGGKVDLQRWRDLALWDVLHQEPPSIAELHRRMTQFPAQIRRMIFGESEPNPQGRYLRSDLEREGTLALRDLGSLDAFQALLCLACEGEWIGDDTRHALPAMCAYDLFPRLVRQHAELRHRWEDLYQCLELIFWSRLYGDGMYLPCSRDEVAERLTLLEADQMATYPLLAGWGETRRPASTELIASAPPTDGS